MRSSTLLNTLSFHSFITLHTTLSRLHHGLPKAFKAAEINCLGWGEEADLYDFLPVIMWFLFGEVPSSSGCLGWATLFYCGTPWASCVVILHSHESGVLASMSRSYTNLLKMNIIFLIGLLYL